jgi:hypothetical protein
VQRPGRGHGRFQAVDLLLKLGGNLRGSPLSPLASVLPVGEHSRFNTTWFATSDFEDSSKLCRCCCALNHADEE